jgi:hypothetical protein
MRAVAGASVLWVCTVCPVTVRPSLRPICRASVSQERPGAVRRGGVRRVRAHHGSRAVATVLSDGRIRLFTRLPWGA